MLSSSLIHFVTSSPGHLRQLDIHQDQVRFFRARDFQRFHPILGLKNFVTLCFQQIVEQLHVKYIVLDNEYGFGHFYKFRKLRSPGSTDLKPKLTKNCNQIWLTKRKRSNTIQIFHETRFFHGRDGQTRRICCQATRKCHSGASIRQDYRTICRLGRFCPFRKRSPGHPYSGRFCVGNGAR